MTVVSTHQINVLERKRPWIVYNEARDEFINARHAKKAAAVEVAKLQAEEAPLQLELK